MTCPHAQTSNHAKFFKTYLRDNALLIIRLRGLKAGSELVIDNLAFPGKPASGSGEVELNHVPGGHKIVIYASADSTRASSNPIVRAVAQILCAELRLKGTYRIAFDFDNKQIKLTRLA